jgi:hypothetical protein
VPARHVWHVGAVGFILLLLAASIGWSASTVNWFVSVPAGAAICATPLLLLNRQRLSRLRALLQARLGG